MALYPSEAYGLFSTDTFSSMEDKKPDRHYDSQSEYNVIIFESESGYERRRLRSRRPKRSYSLSYTNIDGLMKSAIENFYKARSGNFESFTLDLTHLSDSGYVTVRFEGPLKINHVHSAGANVLQNYYTVSFDLKETFD